MRILFSILGLIAAILAVILAILPLEKIALIPAITSLVFILIAFLISKNEGKKLIKFTLIVALIASAIIAYKYIFESESHVKIDKDFIEKNEQSEEKAIEELESLEELDNFDVSDSIN